MLSFLLDFVGCYEDEDIVGDTRGPYSCNIVLSNPRDEVSLAPPRVRREERAIEADVPGLSIGKHQ